MTIDVACIGQPFLDLIFRGLPALPRPGEEVLARELVIVPGAIANVAYALGRLGLSSVVCAPIGGDPAGRLLQELMAEAGVSWLGRPADSTPVSVALPAHGDRSFVTVSPPSTVDIGALAELRPRAVVVDLPAVGQLPPGLSIYAVVGDPEVRMLSGDLPRSLEALASVRALILNEREGCALTGTDDPEEAARRLAAFGTTVVVTCSQAGAVAVDTDGVVYRAGAPSVDVDDPTGAGDLFIAAYVWADLDGRRFEDRLALATRYASLSLEAATTKQKGLSREEFERALEDAALAGPLKEEA
ncbi:MAG: hypothetical protein QOG32_814 [Chloroflexota bacterium]|nr:hypothetical protein [Chloroflexota bacterium]